MGIHLSKDWGSLSRVSAIAALSPNQIALEHDDLFGDYAAPLPFMKPGASVKLFRLIIKLFKEMSALNPEASPKYQMRTLTALRAWAASETSGEAYGLVESLPAAANKTERSAKSIVKPSSNEECHQLLNILHSDRELAHSSLIVFGAKQHVIDIDGKIESIPLCESADGSKACYNIGNLDGTNCYFFALVLRFHNMFHPVHGIIFYPENLRNFLLEAQKLDKKGLFQEKEHAILEMMKLILIQSDSNFLDRKFEKILSYKFNSTILTKNKYLTTFQKVSSAHNIIGYFRKILTTELVNDQFSPEEVETFIEHTFEVVEQLPTQFKHYREAWQTLSKTRSRALLEFKKVRDTNEPLPLPSDFEWTLTAEKEKRQKSIKKTASKRSTAKKKLHAKLQRKQEVETKDEVPVVAAPAAEEPLPPHENVKPFVYHGRVLKYFAEPKQKGISEDQRLHGFALAVDPFVEKYGIKGTWKNPKTNEIDTQWSLPCEVEHHGKVTRGVIVYSIADQNTYDSESAEPVCYHRFIHKRTSLEMIEFINQRSWEWNFPELAMESKNSAKASTVPAMDGSKVIGRRDNVIEIDDPRNDSTIRLFLVDTPQEPVLQ